MFWGAILSALHVLAMGVGLGSSYVRWRGLKDPVNVPLVLTADNWGGIAALLWIGSGIARLYVEKGVGFYMQQPAFQLKMALFGTLLLLEMWLMVTFMRWRVAEAKGQELDLRHVAWFRRINLLEIIGVVAIAFAAAFMARGLWFGS